MTLAGSHASVCLREGGRSGEKHMAAPPACLTGPPPKPYQCLHTCCFIYMHELIVC